MDRKEQAIRRLAAARRRGDFDEVRSFLADEIVWHEPGAADYSGSFQSLRIESAPCRPLAVLRR